MQRVETLKIRKDFIRLRSGRHWSAPALLLQGRIRDNAASGNTNIRVGYTVTTKTGNSIVRNRIKRRLREAVQKVFPVKARPGFDYAVIGKRRALDAEFGSIVQDLTTALDHLHSNRANRSSNQPSKDKKTKQD